MWLAGVGVSSLTVWLTTVLPTVVPIRTKLSGLKVSAMLRCGSEKVSLIDAGLSAVIELPLFGRSTMTMFLVCVKLIRCVWLVLLSVMRPWNMK